MSKVKLVDSAGSRQTYSSPGKGGPSLYIMSLVATIFGQADNAVFQPTTTEARVQYREVINLLTNWPLRFRTDKAGIETFKHIKPILNICSILK